MPVVFYNGSCCLFAHFYVFSPHSEFLYSEHLHFTHLNFTLTVTIHSVVTVAAAANCRLCEAKVCELLNTLATRRCCVTSPFCADEAPPPVLQAANGKPSVDGLHQRSNPELQDTMRRLSSNSEDRSRLASALSCLKSTSEAGKHTCRRVESFATFDDYFVCISVYAYFTM